MEHLESMDKETAVIQFYADCSGAFYKDCIAAEDDLPYQDFNNIGDLTTIVRRKKRGK